VINFEIYNSLFQIFFILFLVAFFVSPIFKNLFQKWKFVDLPKFLRSDKDKTKSRRLHYKIYVRSGGIVVFTICAIGLFIWGGNIGHIWSIYAAMAVLLVGGLLDDRYDISAKYQFLMQLIASVIVVLGGVNFVQLDVGFPGIIGIDWFTWNYSFLRFVFPADLFAVAWLMIMMNAINWVDGVDGLSTGITAIMAATLTLLAVKVGNYDAAILSTILLAGTLGYLPYTFPPAKQTMLGSLGANLYGLILGILTIMGPTKMAGAIIIMIVPVIDMIWVLVGRVNYHSELNPLKLMTISDKTHLHHRLLNMGLTTRQVVLSEYFLVAVVSTISLYIFGSNKAFFVGLGILIVVGFFLAIKIYHHKGLIREVEINEENKYELVNKFNDTNFSGVKLLYRSNNLVGFYRSNSRNLIEVYGENFIIFEQRKILEYISKNIRESSMNNVMIQGILNSDQVSEYMLAHGFSKVGNNYLDLTK